ncbi:MAG: hypothetical protein JXR77_00090, partial [Lentisphaeria bacterium]|nr:hypothetical protein [Lentisphaeria bacterium]
YDLEARLGEAAVAAVAVRVQGAAEAAQSFLTPGSVLVLDADAPGQELPADAVRCRLQRPVTAARRLARDAVSWDRAVLVEGEAFREEGGGQVRVSNEHGNTHGGGCVYAWADAGHWLAWDLPVPASGRYTLGFVVASQEERVLRSLEIDDLPAPGAAVVSFAGTGGWGRVNAEEWQLFQVVDSEGRPVVLEWGEGTHRLRLTNLLGQHMNVDCILLLPLR